MSAEQNSGCETFGWNVRCHTLARIAIRSNSIRILQEDTRRAPLSGLPQGEAHGTRDHHTPNDSISYPDMLSGSLAKVHKPCYVIPTACHSPHSAAIRCFGIQSHQHSLLGVQTHHRFSASAFRAITIFSFGVQSHHRSQFDVQSHHHLQFWRSEPSSSSVPAFRAISIFSPAFRATFQALRAFFGTPNYHIFIPFSARSHDLSLAFRVTLSVRRSKSIFLSFGVQSHLSHSFRHSMPPSLFSLAFKAIVHIRSGTLSPYLSRVLTFKVISPHSYHSELESLAFMFIGIAHLAFMVPSPINVVYSAIVAVASLSIASSMVEAPWLKMTPKWKTSFVGD
uniref:Uncharacterized protein n=1 Tax=Vitis vinifera TaxID=29760 RepID=A5BA88_VITVI|nr:hypothetical protein VITISV_016702 [Vitis vinifera]